MTHDELTLDLSAWEAEFAARRPAMIEYRRQRRVQLGELMYLDFEDRTTVAWQVNRMLGVERITDHERVTHELATYNVLVPGHHELSATLLIGIDDMQAMRRWKPLLVGVNDAVFLSVDGERTRLVPDPEESREHEPPTVQYLRFVLDERQAAGVRGDAPVRIGVDHPNYQVDVPAPDALRRVLPDLLG